MLIYLLYCHTVAAGVDCSTILAIIFAVGQVGVHYIKDAFANFVQDPIQDAVVENALGAATGGAIGDEGAIGDLAEDVGLGDELENATDGIGELAGGAGEAVAGFAEDIGATDLMEGAGDVMEDFGEGAVDMIGEAFGFFADLFGME